MPDVIGVDPGPELSSFVVWNGERILDFGYLPNKELRRRLLLREFKDCAPDHCAIEQIRAYGVPASNPLLDTCFWTGRLLEAFGESRTHLLPRKTVANHHCGAGNSSSDRFVQAAIEDRFGGKEAAIGVPIAPGPLHPLFQVRAKDRSHYFAALAVALAFWDFSIAKGAQGAR